MPEVPSWVRTTAVGLGVFAATLITDLVTDRDDVSDARFDRVTVSNCQSINELKVVLKDILAGAPTGSEAAEDFINDARARLETTDCSRLAEVPASAARKGAR